ncbi:MAG TPA: hypothetical protein VFN64_13555 [Burkholderiaceae bacterium]|nr:hypothetical protein [Burkholderiaceae bacterium]
MPRLLAFGLALALAGCATVDPYASDPIASHLRRDDDVGYCARLFADLDRQVDRVDVRDAEAPRIEGFPYLRIDRLGTALADRAGDGERRKAWLSRLAELDDAGRATELANAGLPGEDLARCRVLLTSADAGRFEQLQARARVPDDYSTAMRAVGLYPLTRLAFAAGIRRWQEETRTAFATPLAQLPIRGRLQRFALAGPAPVVALPMPMDALGVPILSRFDRTALLQRHAPVLEIDVAGVFDRPGTVALDSADRPVVDPAAPVAYVRIAQALIDGRPHLQLVYTFFFTERPARGRFDSLAGRLDGLVWRVTLGDDGTPLVYDTIHPCGCYHLFFPTDRVLARPAEDSLDEGLFAPQPLAAPSAGEVVVLRIESGTHYVQRVSFDRRGEAGVRYVLEDDRRLTVLARAAGGTRSAYGSDGLMAGSERGERYFFWPMGIESAGQMRQWGRHATAFVGRRHFDDPALLNSYFALRTAPSPGPAP